MLTASKILDLIVISFHRNYFLPRKNSVFLWLFRVTGTMFLETDVAIEFFECQCCEHHQLNSIHLHCIGIRKKICFSFDKKILTRVPLAFLQLSTASHSIPSDETMRYCEELWKRIVNGPWVKFCFVMLLFPRSRIKFPTIFHVIWRTNPLITTYLHSNRTLYMNIPYVLHLKVLSINLKAVGL